VVLFVSGTLTSPNATATQVGSDIVFAGGDFSFADVVYQTVDGTVSAETMNGSVRVDRQPDASFSAHGALSVLRNGRTDEYDDVDIRTVQLSSPDWPSLASGTMSLRSPRFAAQPLAIVAEGPPTQASATAPDGSRVVGTEATINNNSGTKFEVYAPGEGSPSFVQTIAEDDPAIEAALVRALQ
jgi:hypothetical protein